MKSWGVNDIPAARRLWAQVKLVCGGTRESARMTCRSAYMNICTHGGGDMACPCQHWLNLSVAQRQILIAARAGMPNGLIALMAGDRWPVAVTAEVKVLQAMASVEPLRSHVERITERVPMWGERAARTARADQARLWKPEPAA